MGRPNSLPERPNGVTIERLMLVTLLVAFGLWIVRPSALSSRAEQIAAVCVVAAIVGRILMLLYFAKYCPVCRTMAVGRVRTVPFGDHYFRCAACGQRSKRYGLGRLWDASGLKDARYFQRDRPARVWDDAPIVPTPDDPTTRTVGTLLSEKLDRTAQAPGPVQAPDLIDDRIHDAPPDPPRDGGVSPPVGERALKTLEAIRWSRQSRR